MHSMNEPAHSDCAPQHLLHPISLHLLGVMLPQMDMATPWDSQLISNVAKQCLPAQWSFLSEQMDEERTHGG